jgi:basic membrane protein A
MLLVTAVLILGQAAFAAPKTFPVGMVTDAGTIDDKSFNQGTWEGIVKAGKDFKFSTKYLKPTGTTEADYVKEIGNLYDAGFKFIVTPGFKFETAIFICQDKYQDAKFVLIDGSPNNGKYDATRQEKVGPNTVSINFAEHESGFLAGVAAALQVKTGEFGFIGGMEIPAVQRFNWGFQQGVAYANKSLGTKIVLKPENVIYQGTFSDVAAGQQLAASMFDKGVTAIFAAAGGVGVGVISEAKTRVVAGKKVWVVGVDVDQYADGVYDVKANKSVILTSAMKGVSVASYDMIKAEREGKFPGGQTLTFNAKNDGIGIPAVNPNLSADVQKKVAKVFADLKAGKIVVADKQGSLIK